MRRVIGELAFELVICGRREFQASDAAQALDAFARHTAAVPGAVEEVGPVAGRRQSFPEPPAIVAACSSGVGANDAPGQSRMAAPDGDRRSL